MATDKQMLTVQNEEQAIAYLEAALEDRLAETGIGLNFDGWPTLSLVYTGDKFHGTITPNVAKALLDLQEAMNRSYMLAVHGTLDLSGMSEQDKRLLQLEASVEAGSSLINIDLGDWASKLSTELVGKMSAKALVVTVLGASAIFTSGAVVSNYLDTRSAERMAAMQQETVFRHRDTDLKTIETISKAIQQNGVVRETDAMAEDVRNSFVKSAIDAETFQYQDSVVITGADAKKLYRSGRRQSQDVQLNGNYLVESFAWSGDGDTATVRVTSVDEPKITFSSELSVRTLKKEQRVRFKDSAFERENVYLNINAKMLNDRVVSAKIVSVDLQPDTAPPKE